MNSYYLLTFLLVLVIVLYYYTQSESFTSFTSKYTDISIENTGDSRKSAEKPKNRRVYWMDPIESTEPI